MWRKRKVPELRDECDELGLSGKGKKVEIIDRLIDYHADNVPTFHVVENEVSDLFRPAKEGPGFISDLYSTHFSKIDRFNANFYKVRPRPTRRRDAKRIYVDLLVICVLNVHGIHIAIKEKNKETPPFPGPKITLSELAIKL